MPPKKSQSPADENQTPQNPKPENTTPAKPKTVEVDEEKLKAMLTEIEDLRAERPKDTDGDAVERLANLLGSKLGEPKGPQVGMQGVMGEVSLGSLNPEDYTDPSEELYSFADKDPRLSRLNLRENYKFEFHIDEGRFERGNVQYVFPHFRFEISRWLFQDDGSPMIREYKDGTTFHQAAFKGRHLTKPEDEVYIRTALRKLGMDTEDIAAESMAHAWRLHELKKWLVEKLLPKKVEYEDKETEKVIGGEVVQIKEFEVPAKKSAFS